MLVSNSEKSLNARARPHTTPPASGRLVTPVFEARTTVKWRGRRTEMHLTTRIAILFAVGLASSVTQHLQSQSAPAPQMPCGNHGDIAVYCGARQPEDLELAPDGKFLIATEYVNQGRGVGSGVAAGGGVMLFDLVKKTFSRMTQTVQADKFWGDPACPGPIGDALVSHGSSLAK